MKVCVHYGTQSIYEHGESVNYYYNKLISENTDSSVIPDWFTHYKKAILTNQLNKDIVKQYHIFHDIGKPFCKQYDDDGKVHYPNHAEKSKQIWLDYNGDIHVANLIGLDMIFHTESYQQILKRHLPVDVGCTLMLTALAELHANSELFGGLESESFKIKLKRLNGRAKKCLREWFDHKFMYGFVRNNISNSQKAVQLGHASIESARQFLKPTDEHPSLIYCVVKSEEKLLKVCKELLDNGVKFKSFKEPDMNNEMTAIVTQPVSYKQKNLFKRYQLLNL